VSFHDFLFSRGCGRAQQQAQLECRWKRIPENASAPFTKWQCKRCVMEGFTTDGRPPKECKRVLRTGGL
jgi:hypothetical protein